MSPERDAHTPGPWHVGPYYKHDVESREGRIAECLPMGSPRAEANARLVAAAPELLAIAYRVTEHFRDTDSPLGKAAIAAIAKVEGRTA